MAVVEDEELRDEYENLMPLIDENGNEEYFRLLDVIRYDERLFVVLMPVGENDGEVTILEVVDGDEDRDGYIPVGDEEVLQTVFEKFKERNSDRFDFQ